MHFTTLFLAAISTTGLVSAMPSTMPLQFEEREAAPAGVELVDVNYGGNGCPQGSVGKAISGDKSVITLFFDKYIAEAGPGVSPAKGRVACQLNLKMKFPQGFQFGVFKADYRGYVNLPDKSLSAFSKATYYFSGDRAQVDREVQWKGPMTSDYFKEDKIDVASTVWSPCGMEGMLNIKSSIGITGQATKASSLTVDSADLKYKQYYHLQWRKCTKGKN